MKKFAITCLVLLLGLFAVDRIGGFVMQWVNGHSKDVICPKLQYIKNDIHEDIVLMGASRCHHHYKPSVIAATLKMTVYNAGIGGSDNIFSHYTVLQHILGRYTPKVVCMEVMPTDYNVQEAPFNSLSFLAPLFGTNESADSIFRLSGSYWKYQVSHLYRYNAKAVSGVWGLLMNRQTDEDHGYIPLPKPLSFPKEIVTEKDDMQADSLKMDYLQRFYALCRQHYIRLVFVISPKYTKVSAEHYDVLKNFAKKNDIPFLDYHTSGLYLDRPDYFKDYVHLWDEGAEAYSSRFAQDLKMIVAD